MNARAKTAATARGAGEIADPIERADDDAEAHGVPTPRAPFDVAEFARDSDSRIRAAPIADAVESPPTRRREPQPDELRQSRRSSIACSELLGAVVSPAESHTRLVVRRDPPASAVPEITMERDDLARFEAEPRARALLQHIDGHATVGAIAAATGAPVADVVAIVADLIRHHVVAIARI